MSGAGAQEHNPKTATPRAFLSYDPRDIERVQMFLDRHASALPHARTVGVTSADDLVRWTDTTQVIDAIQRRYIGDADITVVMLGERTWTRRFVDWEVAASASGGCAVLAVPLSHGCAVPARVRLLAEDGSAIISPQPPGSPLELGSWIATALNARKRVDSGRQRAGQTPLMRRNALLRNHWISQQ